MNREAALQCLEAGLTAGTVQGRDVEFVTSLVAQSKSRGLSDKQWYWVAKLADKLVGTPPAVVGEFSAVYAMFAKAQEHLKHPKIHLQTAGGRHIKLYVSTERSRVPNVVNIVSDDGYSWYGRVYQDGRWEKGNASPGSVSDVEDLIRSFALSPEAIATEYGKLTGNCCFCSRGLKDERSTSVGYGPVCARNFNLRWGD